MIPSFLKAAPLPRAMRRLFTELAIADRERRGSDFAHATSWPDQIVGFEDLAFLFTSTILAHGIASLRLDEAAYLFRLVRTLQPKTTVEIGRFRGGSTFLIAAALEHGVVHSYDIEVRQGRVGAELDRELVSSLARYNLGDRVRLHVADSRTADLPEESIDLLFIDGDHREESVRADFEHWSGLLLEGGHLLLHDAVDAPDFGPTYALGPARVARQIGDAFVRLPAPGSLAHFVRRP